jgi:hypothetical protein
VADKPKMLVTGNGRLGGIACLAVLADASPVEVDSFISSFSDNSVSSSKNIKNGQVFRISFIF